MKLYKVPLFLNTASELTFADRLVLMKVNSNNGGGLIRLISEHQPTSLLGFHWEDVWSRSFEKSFTYFCMLVDAEGAALIRLGSSRQWRPDDFFENPKVKITFDQYGGEPFAPIYSLA